MLRLEALISKLQQEAGLADGCAKKNLHVSQDRVIEAGRALNALEIIAGCNSEDIEEIAQPTCISNDDVLEQELVRHRARRLRRSLWLLVA